MKHDFSGGPLFFSHDIYGNMHFLPNTFCRLCHQNIPRPEREDELCPGDASTLDEFEKGYAERSGLTVERLHELGLHAEPCDCGADKCHGWQMVSQGEREMRELLRNINEKENP